MTTKHQGLIRKAYTAFNNRDIDAVFSTLHPAVKWANGWEGGYVNGYDEIRAYWTRQWQAINPQVEPTGFEIMEDGRLAVAVHQVAKDLEGNMLFDGMVRHLYTFEDDLIKQMDIEKE